MKLPPMNALRAFEAVGRTAGLTEAAAELGVTPGAIPNDARYKDVYAATYRALTYTDTDKPPPRVEAFARQIISSNVPDALLGPAATSPFYDFLIALQAAAEKAKSLDTEAVKAALDSGAPIDGLFGPMTFSAERHSAYGSEVVAMAAVVGLVGAATEFLNALRHGVRF